MGNEEIEASETIVGMTAETVGKDLLSALVDEIRNLKDVWAKLPEYEQNFIIDRLRMRVNENVKLAVHEIAADGRTVVTGDLDQITIKDGVKAVIKFSSSTPSVSEIFEAQGQAVLVVVANHRDYTGGMEEITGESDQRAMDLGHEYDPNGDGKGMEASNEVLLTVGKAA